MRAAVRAYAKVKVIVVKEIQRDAGDGRTQRVRCGEQKNSGHCLHLLLLHPVQQVSQAILALEKEQVHDQQYPGQSERSHDRNVECNRKSANEVSPLPGCSINNQQSKI